MGQKLQVRSVRLGEVTVFDTDRSLTGQEGFAFSAPPGGDEPPRLLARRLFETIEGVDHVHIASNLVTVRRSPGWDDGTVERAEQLVSDLFVHYPAPTPEEQAEAHRHRHYNATISHLRAHHEDLWVIRVKPDESLAEFQPGQYTTLALGYWERRADEAEEELEGPERWKLARRSYSVSSSIVDEAGELVSARPEDVEFYIVKVRPTEVEIPALTPRLFTKGEGDRLFMGRKFAGRYTLEGVEPTDSVVFLATGTGEAPHNAMTAELLRRGHQGRILSVVTIRYRRDLAYHAQQEMVEGRFPNYRYLAMTTREPENEGNKVYIQDLIRSGELEDLLEAPLDPETTHVYLCGNPAMIGLPRWSEEGTVFPQPVGVAQLLHERGFTIDHGRERGNVHYEEYWKEQRSVE